MRWSEAFAATFQDPQDVLDSLPRSRKPMFTFPEEVARVRVPVPPPPPRETLDPRKGPITSVQFTDDGRGISMGELLTCSQDYVRAKMGSAFHRPCPVNFWINIHVRFVARRECALVDRGSGFGIRVSDWQPHSGLCIGSSALRGRLSGIGATCRIRC